MLEALERRAKAFRTDERLYPCRIPREPLLLGDVVGEALPEPHHRFDPGSLRSRTLLYLSWDDGSVWELWIITLPSGLKLFCASGDEEPHILASGGRHASAETDRQFLQILSESAGVAFGIEMSGEAPSTVRTSIADRDFLVDVFVDLLEVTGNESSVRQQLARTGRCPRTTGEGPEARDFRADVEEWLALVMR